MIFLNNNNNRDFSFVYFLFTWMFPCRNLILFYNDTCVLIITPHRKFTFLLFFSLLWAFFMTFHGWRKNSNYYNFNFLGARFYLSSYFCFARNQIKFVIWIFVLYTLPCNSIPCWRNWNEIRQTSTFKSRLRVENLEIKSFSCLRQWNLSKIIRRE